MKTTDLNEMTVVTIIMFMPTDDKSISYGEARALVLKAIGTTYHDEDAKEEYGTDIPSNICIIDRQLADVEKKVIVDNIRQYGITTIFVEGTIARFKNFSEDTISL